MKVRSPGVRALASVLSAVVVVLAYSGISTPELIQNVLAEVLVLAFLS